MRRFERSDSLLLAVLPITPHNKANLVVGKTLVLLQPPDQVEHKISITNQELLSINMDSFDLSPCCVSVTAIFSEPVLPPMPIDRIQGRTDLVGKIGWDFTPRSKRLYLDFASNTSLRQPKGLLRHLIGHIS